MKICLVGYRLSLLSGHARPAYELAKALVERGHEVVIVTNRFGGYHAHYHERLLERERLQGIKVHMPFKTLADLLIPGNAALVTIAQLVAECDLLHGFDLLIPSIIINALGDTRPVPAVLTLAASPKQKLNGWLDAGLSGLMTILKPRLLYRFICPNWLFRRMLRKFDRIIGTSHFIAESIRAMGIPSEVIRVIPVGINAHRLCGHSHADKLGSYVFLYFDWLSSIRGVPALLTAFRRISQEHPRARLVISFPKIYWREGRFILRLVRASPVSDLITIMEFEPNVAKMLSTADVVVLPFRSTVVYAHPPLTLLESMAAGKLVISTELGSIPEIIHDGETGYLIPPGNTEALAEKMQFVIEHPEVAKRIGQRAREYITRHHNWEHVIGEVLETYTQTVEEFHDKNRSNGVQF